LGCGREATKSVWVGRSDPPGVDKINAAIGEVVEIPCGQLRSSRSDNGCDLSISMANGPAQSPAMCSNSRKMPSRVAFETEDTSREVLGKHRLRRFKQAFAPLSLPSSSIP